MLSTSSLESRKVVSGMEWRPSPRTDARGARDFADKPWQKIITINTAGAESQNGKQLGIQILPAIRRNRVAVEPSVHYLDWKGGQTGVAMLSACRP